MAERTHLKHYNTHLNILDRNSSIRTNNSDENCWTELGAVNNDTSSEGEDEADTSVASSATIRNSNLRLSLTKAKHRLSFDKWRSNSQSSATGSVTMHSPTEVASPESPGRLSRWFSIRRGSSHNYDVGGKDGRSGSLEKEIKSAEKAIKMPQLNEVRR